MILEFEAALRLMRKVAAQLPGPKVQERVKLLAALGRVLAEEVRADRDQPPFDRSTRDGYAVRAEEFSAGARLQVAGMIKAGDEWVGEALQAGSAVQIMTGAPVPAGVDTVAMVEHVMRSGSAVEGQAGRRWVAGENIVPRGSEAQAGDVVIAAGVRVGAAEIALAAACGYAELDVWRRPMVAIVATGDELVELDQVPEARQIRNSNSYALKAMVTEAGGFGGRLAIARDLREEIWERVAHGRMWDLLVFSGGVSMGEYDLVEQVLEEFGAEFLYTGVTLQPGKPVVFGRLPERTEGSGCGPACYFFGLPGNPISTQVTFHCFVEPLLRALGGEGVVGPRWALARLSAAAEGKAGLTRLLPGRMEEGVVRVIAWQGSGDLAANARANCYVELPDRAGILPAGTVVRVLMR